MSNNIKNQKNKTKNYYKGWKISSSWKVPIISNTISSEEFYNEYIIKRKPVIIDGHLTDNSWKGYKWDLNYLKEKCPNASIQVEQKTILGTFGLAAEKIDMKFSNFIDKIDSCSYYMTTQQIPESETGYDELFAEPLLSLQSDFPIRPELLGQLVPYQMNLWMGKAINGSSSGLHHDYHDNLYVLLQGKKQFRLFAPCDVNNLYVRGNVSKIHDNGLIIYSNLPTRSDGANPVDVASYNVLKAEQKLQKLEEEYQELQSNTSEEDKNHLLNQINDAESKLDDAMEISLNLCDEYNSDDSEDIKENTNTNSNNILEEYPNFSRLSIPDLNNTNDSTKKEFPLYSKASSTICEIKAGQMLYLPASWFHEVISYTNTNENYHCALNYWVYPPSLNNECNFYKPYEDSYWFDKWAEYIKKKKGDNKDEPPLKKQKL